MSLELPSAENPPPVRAFTVKSVLFGLLGMAVVVVGSAFNDDVLRQTYLVGNHLPIVAVCYLLLLAAVWNPVVHGLAAAAKAPAARRFMFSSAELVVVLGATLVACFAPASGFHRYFMKLLVMPWFEFNTNPGWSQAIGQLPRDLFPLGADPEHAEYENVFNGLRAGLGREDLPLFDWPWREWLAPVAQWTPLIVCFAVASLALTLTVQRQWARHEQLPYPLATIFNGMIDREPKSGWPTVFRSKLFWGAGLAVFLMNAHNLVNLWFPDWPAPIPRAWSMEWKTLFPDIWKSGTWEIHGGTLYCTIIGVAYFLSSEIAFTMGISHYLLALVFGAQFYIAAARPLGTEDIDLLRLGAYIGYAAILLYTGRAWYGKIFLKALGRGKPQVHEAESVWAARVFLLAFAGMTLSLTWLGLSWIAGLAFSAAVMLFMLIFTRIICETGIPFMQMIKGNNLIHYMMKLTGFAFWGPKTVVYFYFLTAMLMQDPRECLMPYGATAFKTADDHGVRARRMFWWTSGIVLAALVIGFAAHGYLFYAKGGGMYDSWASYWVPREIFGNSTRAINQIALGGPEQLELSISGGPMDRLGLLSPASGAWSWVIAGAALVLGFSAARFRWSWWPLHPVLFLAWGTMPASKFFNSFLIGWAVKTLIVQFGGGKVYQSLKPLFLGLIVGELAIAGVGIAVGFVYYYATDGNVPPYSFVMFPM